MANYPGYGPPQPPSRQYGPPYPYPQPYPQPYPGYGYPPTQPPPIPPPQQQWPNAAQAPSAGRGGGCMSALMLIAGLLCSCCPALMQMLPRDEEPVQDGGPEPETEEGL